MRFSEMSKTGFPDEHQSFVLSTHLTKLEADGGNQTVVHRWTGRAIKATPDLLIFLELFEQPVSMTHLRNRFSIDRLEEKIGQLATLGFLLDIATDEEMLWIDRNIGIDGKKIYRTKNFLVYHPQNTENAVPRFAELMEAAHRFLISRGFKRLRRKSIIFVCETAGEYKKLWGHARLGAGIHFFVTKGRILAIKPLSINAFDDSDDRIFKNMVHEMVHIFLCQHYTHLPVWAVEGICEHYSQPDYPLPLNRLMHDKPLYRFKEIEERCRHSLCDIDDAPSDYNIGYRQAHSFIDFLMNRLGERRLLKCILDTGLSRDFRSAFQKHFSLNLENMEVAWRKTIGDQPLTE